MRKQLAGMILIISLGLIFLFTGCQAGKATGTSPSPVSSPTAVSTADGIRLIGERFYYSQDCIWGDLLVGLEYEYIEGKRTGQYITTFDLKTNEKKRVFQIPEDRIAGTPSIYKNRIVWDTIDREEFFKYAASSKLPPPPNYDVFLGKVQS